VKVSPFNLAATTAAVLCVHLALTAPAAALSTDLVSAETTVVLRPDGKATVIYRLEWQARGGEMHGFYFQGEAFKPVWDMARCWADLPDGTRSALSITNLGNKFDVVLAGGKGFSGKAYFNLTYGGDFAGAGLVGRTTAADDRKLVFFDWAPVQWNQSLKYRAVRLVLPIKARAATLTGDEKAAIPVQTEKNVNAENKIDWYGSKGDDGAYYLTGLFYQRDVPTRGSQRLRLYFPEAHLALTAEPADDTSAPEAASEQETQAEPAAAEEERAPAPPAPAREYVAYDFRTHPLGACAVFLPIIFVGLALYTRRLAVFRKKRALLAGMSWAGDAWSPPRILVGSYQVPGKVAEGLHPVEVALLMELPLPRVAAIMIEGLKRQGLVELVSESPLQIRVLGAKKAEQEYEEAFLAAFDSEGRVLSGLMADFFESAIKKLQEKVWDCDIDATKAYYRKRIQEAEAEAEAPAAQLASSIPYHHYWVGYGYMSSHADHYASVTLPSELNTGYAEFMRSAACFSGCFSPAGGTIGMVDACYSACHNA
jgi:hypothetical protein